MSQTERIAYIDRRLRERGWLTASEAAEHFEVSTRQIKRDIEYLRWRLDAPICYDVEQHRYHYEKPYARFQFADERRVLFSALVKGLAQSEAFRPLVTPQILETVTAAVARDFRPVADKILYEAPTTESVDLEVFSALCRALRDGLQAQITYVNLAGQESLRRIEAQRLLNYNGVWYLVALDHLRGALRTFHLGRVQTIQVGSEPVTKSEHDQPWKQEVEAWISSGSGIFRGGEAWKAKVRLRASAMRLAGAQRWHPDQEDRTGVDELGAWLERTVPVVDDRELLARVLGFGAEAQALEPTEFRDRWVSEILKMAQLTRNL